MAGFEALPQAINLGEVQRPLTEEQVAFADQELSDADALAIVVQDTTLAERFILSKNQVVEWESIDNLYRAYVKPRTWPGTDVPRANIGMPVILEAVEKLTPSVYLAFFSDPEPFVLEPTGKTTPEAARARAKVLLWAIEQADFKSEIRKAVKSTLLYGFSISKWGWKSTQRKIKKYVRDEKGRIVPKTDTQDINHPTFESLELRNVLVDPSLRDQDVRKAKYIVNQVFVDANDLDELADDDTYKNIPTREELASILASQNEPATDSMSGTKPATWHNFEGENQTKATSVDPLKQPLEILEYWTADRVITVLQRKIVIRNEANEFGCIPYVSSAFIDIPGAMYGFGVGKLLSGEQRLQQGVLNSWVDTLALQLNPTYTLQKGLGPGTQQIKLSPGKVITETGELKPLVHPSVTTEALNAISTSEARAVRRVGANGGADMPTQALRTAEGVNAFNSSLAEKLQYFVDIFTNLVFVPVLEAFIEMCNEHLTPEQINDILTEAEGKAYQGDILDVYNASCKVKVLSSTKMAARRAAAQMVPTIVQLVSTEPFQDSLQAQGKKFDYNELLDEALELMGWPLDSLVVDMTDEDKQRAAMNNAAAVRAMAAMQLQEKKHQDTLDEINEQGTVRAGNQIVRHVLQESADNPQQDATMAQNLLGGNPQPQQPQPQPAGLPNPNQVIQGQ